MSLIKSQRLVKLLQSRIIIAVTAVYARKFIHCGASVSIVPCRHIQNVISFVIFSEIFQRHAFKIERLGVRRVHISACKALYCLIAVF